MGIVGHKCRTKYARNIAVSRSATNIVQNMVQNMKPSYNFFLQNTAQNFSAASPYIKVMCNVGHYEPGEE